MIFSLLAKNCVVLLNLTIKSIETNCTSVENYALFVVHLSMLFDCGSIGAILQLYKLHN